MPKNVIADLYDSGLDSPKMMKSFSAKTFTVTVQNWLSTEKKWKPMHLALLLSRLNDKKAFDLLAEGGRKYAKEQKERRQVLAEKNAARGTNKDWKKPEVWAAQASFQWEGQEKEWDGFDPVKDLVVKGLVDGEFVDEIPKPRAGENWVAFFGCKEHPYGKYTAEQQDGEEAEKNKKKEDRKVLKKGGKTATGKGAKGKKKSRSGQGEETKPKARGGMTVISAAALARQKPYFSKVILRNVATGNLQMNAFERDHLDNMDPDKSHGCHGRLSKEEMAKRKADKAHAAIDVDGS